MSPGMHMHVHNVDTAWVSVINTMAGAGKARAQEENGTGLGNISKEEKNGISIWLIPSLHARHANSAISDALQIFLSNLPG